MISIRWLSTCASLSGGGPEENARAIRALLGGGGAEAHAAAVAVNAAALITLAGLTDSLADGYVLAGSVLAGCRALDRDEAAVDQERCNS